MSTYKVKNKHSKNYGEVICIKEYCKNNKWTKLKKPVGTSAAPLTDDMLTEFIESNRPDELNLMVKDKKGEIHYVDFAVSDFLL